MTNQTEKNKQDGASHIDSAQRFKCFTCTKQKIRMASTGNGKHSDNWSYARGLVLVFPPNVTGNTNQSTAEVELTRFGKFVSSFILIRSAFGEQFLNQLPHLNFSISWCWAVKRLSRETSSNFSYPTRSTCHLTQPTIAKRNHTHFSSQSRSILWFKDKLRSYSGAYTVPEFLPGGLRYCSLSASTLTDKPLFKDSFLHIVSSVFIHHWRFCVAFLNHSLSTCSLSRLLKMLLGRVTEQQMDELWCFISSSRDSALMTLNGENLPSCISGLVSLSD